MALNGDALGQALFDGLGMDEKLKVPDDAESEERLRKETLEGWKNIGKALVKYLKDNMDITVPTNKVVTQVTGQAVGTPNAAPISCEVK